MLELYKRVKAESYPPIKVSPEFPAEFGSLIKLILHSKPELRPSCNILLKQEIISKFLKNTGLGNKE